MSYLDEPDIEVAKEKQLIEIEAEVNSIPLLSKPDPLSLTCRLAREYEKHDVYYNQILSLFSAPTTPGASHYNAIRYARPDGDCFYRCVSFRLFELMVEDLAFARATLLKMRKEIRPRMHELFGEYTSDFCDVAESMALNICDLKLSTTEAVYEAVTSQHKAGYLMVYFRYSISIYLRSHSEEFTPFVRGLSFPSVELYCSTQVEPFFKPSDNMELMAFCNLFNVTIQLEVLNSKIATQKSLRITPEDLTGIPNDHKMYLLWRPGHYDLLEL